MSRSVKDGHAVVCRSCQTLAPMSLFLSTQEVELLSALNESRTGYIVIGGHAVNFHGYLRPTKDLDIWVEPTEANAARVVQALSSVHLLLQPEYVARLAQPGHQVPVSGMSTELLTSVTGLKFEEAMALSSVAVQQGVPYRVLGLAHLIEYKRRLGRERDLEDVRKLQVVKARGG